MMTFRQDIQMLRGISVILVVLFHLEISGFTSGFLGVDVFFVISGFLMACLYDSSQKVNFFIKRAKRLLPAYFVTVILTVLAAAIITTPNEFRQISEQSHWASLFFSNIGFWSHDSYFSKEHFNALLHLWSLGVEIQFYVIVPILVFFFQRSRLILPLLLLGSLLACFYMVGVSSKTAFFLLPFRLWEFLLGFIAANYYRNIKRRAVMPWLGLVSLFVVLLIPALPIQAESQHFTDGHPGIYALTICLATAGVLAWGIPSIIEKHRISSLLALVGKYSYSVYLVHFPLIVLYLYKPFTGTTLSPESTVDTVVLLVSIVVCSVAMYQLVENPARKFTFNFKYATAPILVVICSFVGTQYQSTKFDNEQQKIFDAWTDRSEYRCGKINRVLDPLAKSCKITSGVETAKQRILLVGNSHADAIKTRFSEVAENYASDVFFLVNNNPLQNGGLDAKAIVQEALALKAETIVFHSSPSKLNVNKIEALVAEAAANQIQVLFIKPIPVWNEHIPQALYSNLTEQTPLPSQTLEDYRRQNQQLAAQLSAIKLNNFHMFESATYFCRTHCAYTTNDGHPLYFDDSHLTLTGSAYLRPLFRQIVSEDGPQWSGKAIASGNTSTASRG